MKKEAIALLSDEDLKNELKRREEERKLQEIPKRFMNPNFAVLHKLLDDYMETLVENDEMRDGINYIYECVMTTFYGRDVFDWINDQIE